MPRIMTGTYGHRGIIGLATPQANPTAENEISLLMPSGVACVTARMVSSAAESRQRLIDYFADITATLRRFDSMPLASAGLACTGSSYVLGYSQTEVQCRFSESTLAYPVICAAGAIEDALVTLGLRRIALLGPYPRWLMDLAESYWSDRGFELADVFSPSAVQGDTRGIYSLDVTTLTDRIASHWSSIDADAYLITGTGIPTLPLIDALSGHLPGPVLSSNLCLAWSCLRSAGIHPAERAATGSLPLLAGWPKGLGLE